MFRSDAPLPEVPRPLHQTPSAEFDSLSGDDSDGGATLAEDVKGKAVKTLGRGESPEAEAGGSCPKKPRTVVRKRRASVDAR